MEKMTVKERILTIKLMEKMKKDPQYAKQLGIKATHEEKSEACIRMPS